MQSYLTYGKTPLQYSVLAASFEGMHRLAPLLREASPEPAGLLAEVRHGAR
jgi:hypothetical protein